MIFEVKHPDIEQALISALEHDDKESAMLFAKKLAQKAAQQREADKCQIDQFGAIFKSLLLAQDAIDGGGKLTAQMFVEIALKMYPGIDLPKESA